ncbi:MAG: hypothetical protein LBJ83_00185 [Oscillospiraceae bacterium]|nr:hypothetical protein [Oscillospiraceae bacterium]
MNKFLVRLISTLVAVSSFVSVGVCMSRQTKDSVYLSNVEPGEWLSEALNLQLATQFLKLKDGWNSQIMVFRRIVESRPPVAQEDQTINVNMVIQDETEFNLLVPVEFKLPEGCELPEGQEVASFYIRLAANGRTLEDILKDKVKPDVKEVKELRFTNTLSPVPYNVDVEEMEKFVREGDPQLNFDFFQESNQSSKIILINIEHRASGYIATPSGDASLDAAQIWFSRPLPGYEAKKFYPLATVLNDYWEGNQRVAQAGCWYC